MPTGRGRRTLEGTPLEPPISPPSPSPSKNTSTAPVRSANARGKDHGNTRPTRRVIAFSGRKPRRRLTTPPPIGLALGPHQPTPRRTRNTAPRTNDAQKSRPPTLHMFPATRFATKTPHGGRDEFFLDKNPRKKSPRRTTSKQQGPGAQRSETRKNPQPAKRMRHVRTPLPASGLHYYSAAAASTVLSFADSRGPTDGSGKKGRNGGGKKNVAPRPRPNSWHSATV